MGHVSLNDLPKPDFAAFVEHQMHKAGTTVEHVGPGVVVGVCLSALPRQPSIS